MVLRCWWSAGLEATRWCLHGGQKSRESPAGQCGLSRLLRQCSRPKWWACSCPEKMAAEFQPEFDLLLQEDNDKNAWILIHKPVVGFVVDKGWTYQYHVVELATKWATPFVHEELSVARVCRPHGECVKQNVVWVHLYLNIRQTRAVYPRCSSGHCWLWKSGISRSPSQMSFCRPQGTHLR